MKSIKEVDYNKLIELLYQLRISSGLRQSDIADKLDVPQSFVSKLESGERHLDILEFIAYCECLQANPIDIFKQLYTKLNDSKSDISKTGK